MFDYLIDEQILQKNEVFKNLGVTLVTRMSFVNHINNTVRDAINHFYYSKILGKSSI